MDAQTSFLDTLFDRGILHESGVDGLYARSALFEDVIRRFEDYVIGLGRDETDEAMVFPPGMTMADFETSGYMKNFPQLAGTVHAFCGDTHDHMALLECLATGKDWTDGQKRTGLALTPAACYPLYPIVARRGALPEGGLTVALQSYCFRHEPSKDPARMQMFRQREYVRVGSADEAIAFRETWKRRGSEIMTALELPHHVDVANDPFFGRAGKMMGASQREQELKFEMLVPITSSDKPTACMSFNYHQDNFGKAWNIRQRNGEPAHTACVGFGLERITLALLRHHGLEPAEWPDGVRKVLWG
ncbi:amino acid--[acyl-carrier-protein] ligase [Stappia sp. F7233]|uniref:Amino acid--[acyl-carrier-protein] ligase n=1 Tax=Stappia albiluteola TaxID=2758565 RepID=A0A839A9R4_9HYPH|nr:amino acid--[acyl-carrier-protein] ligase [Stappia albiluteola]MBA5775926.1 amino acid--[acyl-carrier-protein] ligase [Stappia albiluteola]